MISWETVAAASSKTDWTLDIKTPNAGPGAELQNGPFPVREFVPSNEDYRGEIIVRAENGHLPGLDYAWVTDEPPARWPRPDEIEIVNT